MQQELRERWQAMAAGIGKQLVDTLGICEQGVVKRFTCQVEEVHTGRREQHAN